MPRVSSPGGRKFLERIRRLSSPDGTGTIGNALYAAGDMIAVDAAISITTGAVSGKGHVPSAPGEPPNADTHGLDRSIETVLAEPLRVEVSANAPYAKALEHGTSKTAERPFMRPALVKNRKKAVAMVRRAVRDLLRR